jgi:hypothetical protein
MKNKIEKVGKVFVHSPTRTVVETRDILTSTICGLMWTINTNLHSQDIVVKMQSLGMLFLISSSPQFVS